MPDISQELCKRFEAYAETPEHSEQVIVTLSPDADRAELARSGMVISREMKNRPIVIGTITAGVLQALSEWDGVERIELDSDEMRALDN